MVLEQVQQELHVHEGGRWGICVNAGLGSTAVGEE